MSYTLNLETDEEAKEMQKAALILEGGAKRGIFTSGVLDYLMEKKVELLKTAALCNDDSEKVLEQFFRLVLAQKREKFLQFMIWSYIGLYRRENNILMGRLTTAVPSPVLEKRMTTIIEGKTSKEVEFYTSVDPNIIGGYVLEMVGYRIDASISSQLKRVKNQFVSKNRRIV